MHERDRQVFISHIESLTGRSPIERKELEADLLARLWPRGVCDRSEPSALEWLRRWGPVRRGAEVLGCSCALGRCAVCN
jgi:hypothetical protein